MKKKNDIFFSIKKLLIEQLKDYTYKFKD